MPSSSVKPAQIAPRYRFALICARFRFDGRFFRFPSALARIRCGLWGRTAKMRGAVLTSLPLMAGFRRLARPSVGRFFDEETKEVPGRVWRRSGCLKVSFHYRQATCSPISDASAPRASSRRQQPSVLVSLIALASRQVDLQWSFRAEISK
jgi:hypothetical protein